MMETPDSDQRLTKTGRPALRRILGAATVVCVGLGSAVGSGIFATPGEAATYLSSPWLILLAWLIGGIITLLQSLVTAELATRFPKAGGEYQYLKEAYGDFAAFFFGWSFTVFIVGGGAGTIAAALGDFAADLVGLHGAWAAPIIGCMAIVTVSVINAMGLRTGAVTQNLLTGLKTAALLAIAVGIWMVSDRSSPVQAIQVEPTHSGSLFNGFLLVLVPVFWSYSGATDSAKLAEEVRDVHRALPRALIGTSLLLTGVYLIYNYALFCALSPAQMAGARSVPALAFANINHFPVRQAVLIASILICLGAISSVFLANVRVTYALARDGLTFRFLAGMSRRQAPVAALLIAAAIACAFVLNRSFGRILRIYLLASTVLFGLTYVSLIVFRLRDRRAGRVFPKDAYKVPAGWTVVIVLILLELLLATGIIWDDVKRHSSDSLLTLALLAGTASFYFLWRRIVPPRPHDEAHQPASKHEVEI